MSRKPGAIQTTRKPLVEAWAVSADAYAAVMAHLTSRSEEMESAHQGASAERATPVELQSAVAALEAESYASAITLASAHCQHPGVEVRADAHRLCALAHSRQGTWEEAFAHFHSLFEHEATARNALELATTSVMTGELLRGQAWFEKAEEMNSASAEMPAGRLRTNYISALEQRGELAAIVPHLEWLAGAYQTLSITDSNFLWMRGLPFFSEFLAKSLPILRSCMSDQQIHAWYLNVREALDAEGKDALDRHVLQLRLA